MRSGVRCAEMMRTSCAMPSSARVSAQWRMVSQSDWEPMTMPTTGLGSLVTICSLAKLRDARRA